MIEERREGKKQTRDAQELRFFMESFTPIMSSIELKEGAKRIHLCSPNNAIFKRNFVWEPINVFLKVANISIWDHIAHHTYQEMERKHRSGEISDGVFSKYYKKKPTAREILQIFGLRHYFRGKAANKKIEKQFHDLPSNFVKISRERFNAISGSLSCNWDELSSILRNSWSLCVMPCDHFVVDEAMFAFQTRTDPTCPKRYIPRKPHKNGLLVYLATTKTAQNLPYSFDLELDNEVKHKLNPRDALLCFLERFPWKHIKPHVTVDAGFSSNETFSIINDKSIYFLSSVNAAHKKWLYDLLAANCPQKNWIAVKDRNGLIWSLKKHSKKNFFLVTNSYREKNENTVVQPDPVMSASDISTLSKLSTRALFAIAQEMGISLDDVHVTPAEAISSYINNNQMETTMIGEKGNEGQSDGEIQDSSDEFITSDQDSNEEEEDSSDNGGTCYYYYFSFFYSFF